MGMHLSAHSQQTKPRLMYYAPLNTLSLLNHSAIKFKYMQLHADETKKLRDCSLNEC